MRQLYRMDKLNGLQRLHGNLSDLSDLKTFVIVLLNEIVQTLAKRFEYEAHVGLIRWRLFCVVCFIVTPGAIHKRLFQVDDSVVTASLLLKVIQN